MKNAALALCSALLIIASGCSSGLVGKRLWAVERCNAGAGRIYDIRIEYGHLVASSKEMIGLRRACGSSDTSYVEIPESITVSWKTADGVAHREVVPVRSRIDRRLHLRKLIFTFDEGTLQVQQFLSFDDPWVLGRDVTLPLYP